MSTLANRELDAADNLNAVEGNPLHPRYDNNRFGGNLGGPIKKDKLFFFVDWEYNPSASPQIRPTMLRLPPDTAFWAPFRESA